MYTKLKKRGQLQISFAWLFAIIVGAIILFLAIYVSTKVFNTGENATNAKAGKEISVLSNPLETGFESGIVTLLTLPVESRIYNQCDSSEGNFGFQIIRISEQSFGKFPTANDNLSFPNKYIFSDGISQGKNFFVFSKQFDFPFKVSDLIYLTSSEKNYCFADAPNEIKKELSDLKEQNIFTENCPEKSVKVCFRNSACDIKVNENLKSVKKKGQTVYYETDALMYAAIFSDKDVYECQVKRLMIRVNTLASIYSEKQLAFSSRGCEAEVNVGSLNSAATAVSNSEDLANTANTADELNRQNNVAVCRVW